MSELKRLRHDEIFKLPTIDPLQVETKAVMKWILDNPFALSISFHGGALGSFFPYDDGPSIRNRISPTPDNALMKELANIYARNHENMHKGKACPKTTHRFKNGVSNGAKWYALSGGMTDFNYLFSNCFEITVELSCCKYPKDQELDVEWRKNKNSMVKFLQSVHIGVKGLVMFQNGTRLNGGEVHIEGNKKVVTTSTKGEYWRLLPPGNYKMKAGLPFEDTTFSDAIEVEVKEGEVTRQDFTIFVR